jgi:hypothetical protein
VLDALTLRGGLTAWTRSCLPARSAGLSPLRLFQRASRRAVDVVAGSHVIEVLAGDDRVLHPARRVVDRRRITDHRRQLDQQRPGFDRLGQDLALDRLELAHRIGAVGVLVVTLVALAFSSPRGRRRWSLPWVRRPRARAGHLGRRGRLLPLLLSLLLFGFFVPALFLPATVFAAASGA